MVDIYSNELPYEYMPALRTTDEATSWQPFVRPDPWLRWISRFGFFLFNVGRQLDAGSMMGQRR